MSAGRDGGGVDGVARRTGRTSSAAFLAAGVGIAQGSDGQVYVAVDFGG